MNNSQNSKNLGRILKQQRLMKLLTLAKLATISSISPSYLGRIERGERFPSASVLKKIANPLGFEESELLSLAGYLSLQIAGIEKGTTDYSGSRVDPYVSKILSHEPIEIQHAAIEILSIIKIIAKAIEAE